MLSKGLESLRFKPQPRRPVVKVSSSHTSSSFCLYLHHATEAAEMSKQGETQQFTYKKLNTLVGAKKTKIDLVSYSQICCIHYLKYIQYIARLTIITKW